MEQRQKKKVRLCTIIFIVTALLAFENLPVHLSFLNKSDNCDSFVEILDVGQGSCAVIKSGNATAMIDFGTLQSSAYVCGELKRLGINKIDMAIASHLHSDHIGGLDAVINSFSVERLIIDTDYTDIESVDAKLVKRVKTAIGGSKTDIIKPEAGHTYSAKNVNIKILFVGDNNDDENDCSVICKVTVNNCSFLFTGDSSFQSEEKLIKYCKPLKCDVLIAGHHGSKNSSCDKLLNKVSPKYTAVSCGIGNTYSFPSRETVSRIEKRKIKLYRTDINGNIKFVTENGKISVLTEE